MIEKVPSTNQESANGPINLMSRRFDYERTESESGVLINL